MSKGSSIVSTKEIKSIKAAKTAEQGQWALPALYAGGTASFEDYLARVQAIPLLTEEEEYTLAKSYQDQSDLKAAQKLVLAHIKYVVKVAKSYMGYGLALQDLVQEGAVGLMKAVKRFNPEMGVRLVSFAVHWIKAEIHEFILKNWRIVKVATTKAQRKLFFNLRQSKARLGWFTKEEVKTVAQDLGVSTAEVLRMEERLNSRDFAFDLPVNHDEEEYSAPATYLEDEGSDPSKQLEFANWNEMTSTGLENALKVLDARSLDILQKRWLVQEEDKATLQDLAQVYQVSLERIRQLEKNAILKLKKQLIGLVEAAAA
ncbi:MAG: RNA polymerase sigma factor RpoH [Gammaproteobacteria bacterium]